MPDMDIYAEEKYAPGLDSEAVKRLGHSVSVDQEIGVMRTCVEALDEIDHDPAAMSRVIRYLADRYGSERLSGS